MLEKFNFTLLNWNSIWEGIVIYAFHKTSYALTFARIVGSSSWSRGAPSAHKILISLFNIRVKKLFILKSARWVDFEESQGYCANFITDCDRCIAKLCCAGKRGSNLWFVLEGCTPRLQKRMCYLTLVKPAFRDK